MTNRQFLIVAICIFINAIDGFDILSISLASPDIAAEWGVGKAALGIMLSAELVGMGVGSILLGQLADRLGRRPVLLFCLLLMTAGMLGAALAPNFLALATVRLFTGIGIGGMLPCLSAIVAEVANRKWRSAAVALMAAGYPLGAVLGGSIATRMLADGEWRDVFMVGAFFSALMVPVCFMFLPESLGSLMRRFSGERRVALVNRALHMLGRAPLSGVPDLKILARPGMSELFSKAMIGATLLLTAAYFMHMISFYFFLKWVPQIVADMGFTSAEAGSVLVWANVGGLIGSLLFSVLTLRYFVGPLLIAVLGASFILLGIFGNVGSELQVIGLVAVALGLVTNAAVVGLYALIAEVYPDRLRAGGAGFSLGVGRGGAALGPVAGGLLFAGGMQLELVTFILGGGSLIAVILVACLLRVLRGRAAEIHSI